MTYLDYIVFFQKMDREKAFSANATRLYLKLLDVANGMGFPAEFAKPDPYVKAVCGCSLNTMKEAREMLVTRGLLAGAWGNKGRASSGTYRLLAPAGKLSNSDSLPAEDKLSRNDSLPADKLSNPDSLTGEKLSEDDSLPANEPLILSAKLSNSDTLYKEEEKRIESAAVAASSVLPSADKKPKGKASKKAGATPEEIAAIVLPHPGPELASLWATFATGPKQAGKPLTALDLMARKLGKYPEGFAVVMLECAIQGNWSGVENDGTAEKYAKWQHQEAHRPTAPAVAAPAPALPINEDFVNEQKARQAAEQSARFNRFAATATVEQ